MIKKMLIIFSIILALTSCRSIIDKNNVFYTGNNIELGVVGEKLTSIIGTNFQLFGNPQYTEKIKLNISINPFTKNIYKKYLKNTVQQGKRIKISRDLGFL